MTVSLLKVATLIGFTSIAINSMALVGIANDIKASESTQNRKTELLRGPSNRILGTASTESSAVQVVDKQFLSQSTGTIRQSRETAVRALQQAAIEVEAAIVARDSGEPIPADVAYALAKFFPRESADFLYLLLRRIELVAGYVPNVRIRYIREVSQSDVAIGAACVDLHQGALASQMPALACVEGSYIAVYPRWYWQSEQNLQPTRLVHEAFHMYFSFMRDGHPRNTRRDPYAYQGFISELGELDTGSALENQYPDTQR